MVYQPARVIMQKVQNGQVIHELVVEYPFNLAVHKIQQENRYNQINRELISHQLKLAIMQCLLSYLLRNSCVFSMYYTEKYVEVVSKCKQLAVPRRYCFVHPQETPLQANQVYFCCKQIAQYIVQMYSRDCTCIYFCVLLVEATVWSSL